MINKFPILEVNTFPYSHGFPNSWIYYKTITDPAGNLMHYKKLHHGYAWDSELQGMTIHDMGESELTESVSHFIGDLENPNPAASTESDLKFPGHTIIGNSGGRLLPGYLALYDRVASQQV